MAATVCKVAAITKAKLIGDKILKMKNSKIFLVWIALILFVLQGEAQDQTTKKTTARFKVFDVCEQCIKRLEDTAKGKGVRKVDWNIDTKMVSLVYVTFQTSLYAGSENITNFYQKDAILPARQPFNQYFDASPVWGPLSGRMFYVGWRYKIKA